MRVAPGGLLVRLVQVGEWEGEVLAGVVWNSGLSQK